MSVSKLVLIDGNSIAYRAFFALPLLNNQKGVYTNAVYGFATMLMKIIEEEQPTHMLVAFDAGKTTFRHKTYKEYKGGRQKTPPELSEQFPLVRELLDAYKISRYEAEQYEADDIIGTLAKQAAEKKWEVKVYSGDKDLLQLVDDNVTVVLTKKGITNVEAYDLEMIEEKYGIKPKQIIDMKGLMGDSSDNIPGVPGIGEKTALKLLKQYGTVEKVLQSIDEISGKKMKERLEENREQALMSKELATIFLEVPIEEALDQYEFGKFETNEVVHLLKELEFTSLLEKLDVEVEQDEVEELDYDIVHEVKKEDLGEESAVLVEVLEEHYHQAEIIGIAIVNEKKRLFIKAEEALASEEFLEWLEDDHCKKWVFDAKKSVVALAWKGAFMNGVDFDVQMASYLLDPSLSSHDIHDVASRKGKAIVQADEVVYGKGAKQKLPEDEELASHIVRKAEAVYRLKSELEEELVTNEQDKLYRELEMPLSIVIGHMEKHGVKVDQDMLNKMGEDLEERLAELEKTIHSLAGESFNINSPKQLGEILFVKLGLPPVKKTKTGYSTSADVLEKLAVEHEIAEYIVHYRQLGKLKSTYIEGLSKVVKKDTSKIHTRYNQALTQTGRLSSTDPNLQNIPIRLEEGRKIRKAFVPATKGWKMVAADYSQIELRVLAHIAGDEKLIEAFNKNMDIHTITAMDVFHVKEEDVTSQMRRSAKAVNFGIVYGISDYGLSQNLNITRKEAAEFIERYFNSYPKVKEYMDRTVADARKKGFVSTLLQRRRYLPDLTSRNFNKRSFAERTAMNTPIQGTAADIIKKAMVQMSEEMEKRQVKSRMLLQVHDELIFEVPEDELDRMMEIIPEVMEQAVSLDVPLKVDISYGDTWYDAK
ncbi:DNA polymerase I [Halalkalibacter sp. APA_J-10(15)]|uniref:DNA polymerase I n=1 Tax=Halalkalibacter sp. APA_J-10(15) TaxID=2933805 RepID=UPI001FF382CC|nr:DNA polymerase I [Halalkalibacter sp. APA_J-10(15)]MCK0471351.1 DNA polymerase I [Halalkalibacter sp. APA_J-10(15)]